MSLTNPRRFVPTLTDVVEGHLSVERLAFQPPAAAQAPNAPGSNPQLDPSAFDDTVAMITATVTQQLNDLIREAVTTQLQAQQLLLVQHLRNDLMQSVEQLVKSAVSEHLPTPQR